MVAAEAPPGEVERGLAWLGRFERARGRRLRVLHLGNIANNAYNNAKIQRRYGIDADVACADYYHVMACPEWEDAELAGAVGDPLCPDWRRAGVRNFRRPRWFVQGSVRTCQRYLLARGVRDDTTALWWRVLAAERWLRCRQSRPAAVARFLAGHVSRFRLAFAYAPTRPARRPHEQLTWPVRRGVARARLVFMYPPGRPARNVLERLVWPVRRRRAATWVARRELDAERIEVHERLAARFGERFPERGAPLSPDALAVYGASLLRWRDVLPRYDVVHAYGTDAAIPLACGIPAYAAYEHGTLRDIPFEGTPRGDLCALSYLEAAAVFVTNLDVLPSARRLGLDPERLVLLPHAVDSDRLFAFAAAHASLAPRAGDPVTFFSPTRQDWVDADPSWTKGNDRSIRALRLVLDGGHRCRLVLAAWGRDLEASRRLVEELALDEVVEWLAPVAKRALWEAYLRAHAVLDQFVLPAIGGVAFEAMALGRRVITALDVPAAAAFFGEPPPLHACSEPEEIAAAMLEVLDDPLDEAGLGLRAQQWFAVFHSAERIVGLQADAYRRLVDGRG